MIRMCVLAGIFAAAATGALQAQTAPAENGAPAVTDAGTRGTIPSVSMHTAALPVLYDFDHQPMETISPLVGRQYLSGVQSTIVRWTVKAGGVFALHHHASEQITWITEGECSVFSQGRQFDMKPGMVLIIPPNVPHEFHCSKDTIDIDFFAPARQDWADGALSSAATAPKR